MTDQAEEPHTRVREMADEVANYWRTRTFVPYRELVNRLFDITAGAKTADIEEAAYAHQTLSAVRREMILFLMGIDRPGVRFSGYFSLAVLAALAVILALKEIPPAMSAFCGWAAVAAIVVCALAGIVQAVADRLRGAVLPQLDEARQHLEQRVSDHEAGPLVTIERERPGAAGSTVRYTRRLRGREAEEYDQSLSSRQGMTKPFTARAPGPRPTGIAFAPKAAPPGPVAGQTSLSPNLEANTGSDDSRTTGLDTGTTPHANRAIRVDAGSVDSEPKRERPQAPPPPPLDDDDPESERLRMGR